MLEHLPGLIAGLIVAIVAIFFNRRAHVAPKIMQAVKTATDKVKQDKINSAEQAHAEAHEQADEEAKTISEADLDLLAEMANHEFGSD